MTGTLVDGLVGNFSFPLGRFTKLEENVRGHGNPSVPYFVPPYIGRYGLSIIVG